MPREWELVLRLVIAAALAGAIGLEREARDQPAGFRTHMLVALGACLFTLVSAYSFESFLARETSPQFRYDPTRIAAQIVTGIGFLGAGAIIRYGLSVRGLTTAASLWVVAAIGTAVGLGGYLIAAATTTVTLLTLFVLRPVRTKLVRGVRKEHEAEIRIDHVRVEEEDAQRQIVLVLTLPAYRTPEEAVALLSRTPGVRNVDWTR